MSQRNSNTDKTIGNGDSALVREISRINLERENQRILAIKRNATPTYAFLYQDKRHCETWTLSQLADSDMSFVRKNDKGESVKTRESVIVGRLSSALMVLNVGAKGEIQRGGVKPIAFWFIKATGEYGAFNGATQDERDTVTLYVGGLMKKHLDGLATIAKGNYKAVKGYDSRKAVFNADKTLNAMGKFMSAYLGKKNATQDEINLIADSTKDKAIQTVTPVVMD